MEAGNGDNSDAIYLAAVEGGGTTFVVSVARVIVLASDADNNSSNSDANDKKSNIMINIGSTKLQLIETITIPSLLRSEENADGQIIKPNGNNYTPQQIINETCLFFQRHLPSCGYYSALGIATFGPAGVDASSFSTSANNSNYGKILPGSPKKLWRDFDILSPIKEACGLLGFEERVAFDTDVNAPALAEFRHRCYLLEQQHQQQIQRPSKPLTSLSYVTIGTGVGVGLIVNSQPLHGLLHPEGGHICVQPLSNDKFTGYSWGSSKSPYMGIGTVEGIASSVALTERWIQMEQEREMLLKNSKQRRPNNSFDGADATKNSSNANKKMNGDDAETREILTKLPDSHPIWLHASNAIANLCVSILLLTSCQKIVLGGGIMKREILYPMIRSRVWTLLNGYLDSVDELSEESKLENIIVNGSWEDVNVGSGLVGAFALALDVYEKSKKKEGEGYYKVDEDELKVEDGAVVAVVDTASIVAGGKKKETKMGKKREQHYLFASGFVAGIVLSIGCAVTMSLLRSGSLRR